MKRNLPFIILILIVLLGFLLRFWQLGRIPEGFYSDEALYGYEAYSILKTGKDQFGNTLPLSIAGFGDYRPALYIYITIPFILILGLTEFATRFPSALSSFLTIIILIFLLKKLFNLKIALFSGLIFAISPWGLFFARMAHETNFLTLQIISALYLLLYAKRNKWYFLLSLFILSLSFYTYHNARVFVPLFLIYLCLFYFDQVKSHIKLIVVGVLLLSICLIPLYFEFKSNAAWARVNSLGFWNDPGTVLRINETRGNWINSGISPVISKIFVNKATFYPLIFINNWLLHFSPDFLIINGDKNGIYNTPHNGILLWVEPLLIVIGCIYLFRIDKRMFWILLGFIGIALIPDALTRASPSSARIHLALPAISTLTGIGIYSLSRKKSWLILVTVLIMINYSWFLYNYLVTRPRKYVRDWQVGTKEMIYKANKFSVNYDQVWMSRNDWGWIHLLFHLKYDPAKWQKEVKVEPRNELGFWWVTNVGKYHLDWFPKDFIGNGRILFIGFPQEFPSYIKPIDKVIDPYGNDVFWFVDKIQLINL